MGIFTPNTPFIVDAMLIGETIIMAMLVLAFFFARMHKGKRHHFIMLAAFLIDMLIFKPAMAFRAFDGSSMPSLAESS